MYLNFSDLFPMHLWVGATLAYSYQIDSRRLQQAVQKLVQSWPVLAGRYHEFDADMPVHVVDTHHSPQSQ